MANKYRAKTKVNKIICAICGCEAKSNGIKLLRHTKQAVHEWHTYTENFERPGPQFPTEAQVPKVQKIPETDNYDLVGVQTEPSLNDIVPANSNG